VDVIVGLGNPGREYDGTRHNVGFRVVNELARRSRTDLRAGRGEYLSGSGRIAGRAVELALPLTYMNLSGLAVRQVLAAAGSDASGLLVVCDDVNLPLGTLRLRRSGSDGGHNGLSSIIFQLGTEEFARLRLGVGAAPDGTDLADHVLDRFGEEERPSVEEMVSRAADAIGLLIARGLDTAMQEYNRRPADEPDAGS